MATLRFLLDDGTEQDLEVEDDVYNLAAKNPNYARVLRDSVQEKAYFGRRIDSTPFKYKSPLQPVRGGLLSMILQEDKEEEGRRQQLAESGITVGAGPFNKAEISYFQGLAKDSPYEFAEFFIPKVKEKVAPRENLDPRNLVKVGEDGRVRFLDLKTQDNPNGSNRWTEFEGLGIDPFNALELGLDVAGSISAAKWAKKAGLKPFKEAVATSVGAGVGATDAELARQALGKFHGITDEVDFGEVAERGGLAATGSIVGSGIGRAWHNLRNTENPYFFNPDTAAEFEKSATRGQRVQSDINDMPGGEDFAPDLAQLSGEQSLLDLRATLINRGGATSEMKTTARILTKDQTNNRILNNLLYDLTATPRTPSALETGRAVQEFNLQQIMDMPPSKKKSELLQLYNENLKARKPLSSAADIADVGRQSIISKIRGSAGEQVAERTWTKDTGLVKIVNDLKKSEQKAWGEYNQKIAQFAEGYGRPMEININKVIPGLHEFIYKARATWNPVSKKKLTQVLDPIMEAAARKDGFVDLAEVNVNLSSMKELSRIAQKENKQDSPSVLALEAAIANIQKIRDDWILNVMKRPDIADSLLAAEASTRRVNDIAKRSVASKFLLKKGDSYAIRNPDTVFEDIMIPGNPEGMRQWIDIVGDDPALVQATRDFYGQHYHNSVMRNGLANPNLHNRWMRDYGAQAEQVFGQDFHLLKRLGGIGHAVKAGEKKLKKLEQAARISSNGKIDRLDPEKVVESVLGVRAKDGSASLAASKLSALELNEFMRVMRKESPETVELLQNRTKEMIRMSVFGDELTREASRPANSKMLQKFLEEGSISRLNSIMGPQYAADLLKVKRGLEIMERSGKGVAMPMETPSLSLFRVAFGPLSRTQRFITGARRYSIIGQEQKLAEIISDPKKLREVMRAANLPAKSPTAIAILTSLGLLEATN